MILSTLCSYDPITIQCHDNPDPDTVAAGFALYNYFLSKGNRVRLIYSGHNNISKSNIRYMVNWLDIPLQYRAMNAGHIEGLLIMVDCQYGTGNAQKFTADHIAVVDHHQLNMQESELTEIQPDLASASTLCWKLLMDEGFEVNSNLNMATALYYGLYMDSNSMAELYNPLDLDMRDYLKFDKALFSRLRNCNLSRKELEVAGVALIRNIYNEKHRFAVVRAGFCDPNLLGLISDFLLQVDDVDTCVVYNEQPDGFKVSVRSCVREVKADELAEYICGEIGTGGGHHEKAGGFIDKRLYEKNYPSIHSESYFGDRINSYFEDTEIIRVGEYEADLRGMKLYKRKDYTVGYVRAKEIFPINTPILIRSLEGDVEVDITDDLILMIGVRGEVYHKTESNFAKEYIELDGNYSLEDSCIKATYIPKVTNKNTGESVVLTEYAHRCTSSKQVRMYVKPLDRYVKVFSDDFSDAYILGKPGDYLVIRADVDNKIRIMDAEVFEHTLMPLQGRNMRLGSGS